MFECIGEFWREYTKKIFSIYILIILTMPTQMEENYNQGASTSSGKNEPKAQEKKKNVPWIELYRPKVFEEIMGN